MNCSVTKYVFHATGREGPRVQDLWKHSSNDPQAMRDLVAFFYPIIDELAQFYADQTEQPDLTYDDFLSYGFDLFQSLIDSYSEDQAHSFMTAAKRRINKMLFEACRDAPQSPPAALAQKDVYVPALTPDEMTERTLRLQYLYNRSVALASLSAWNIAAIQMQQDGYRYKDIAATLGAKWLQTAGFNIQAAKKKAGERISETFADDVRSTLQI